ncbi:MAG: holo-ACP synthase [Firmicutes bacterium]|nr:holo-ACP synthase [Bacillota bacterium]
MILGIGTDIIEIDRVGRAWTRKGTRFVDKICSPREAKYILRGNQKAQWERMAARFAGKEAVMKALGTGWRRGVAWREIEILHEPSGRPYVNLLGKTAQLAEKMGIKTFHISMSHNDSVAVAYVIALGDS